MPFDEGKARKYPCKAPECHHLKSLRKLTVAILKEWQDLIAEDWQREPQILSVLQSNKTG
jgi:hypothetical protein